MNAIEAASVPVLSCDEARELEQRIFRGNEAEEWRAMQAAGSAIGSAVVLDFREIGEFPPDGRILVLVGKGHNGGDALIAARSLLSAFPRATAEVVFAFGERALRPLAARAWREFQQSTSSRIKVVGPSAIVERGLAEKASRRTIDLCLDGIFGFQFRPPLESPNRALLETVNALPIRLRAAVDLPSGDLFRADFTYATGSVKAPVLSSDNAGRVRYLDLGFFGGTPAIASSNDRDSSSGSARDLILTDEVLRPLAALRAPRSDKREFGHVFIVGGSRGYPGAVLMCAMAAIRSGAGLVTVFVPESLQPAFAARLPEAMWVAWPETPSGSLALEGEHLLRERLQRADALVIGPGLGREPETLALVQSIVQSARIPIVLDADALQPEIVDAGGGPRVITPHLGEFKRLAGDADLRSYAQDPKITVVLKGPTTRICNRGPIYHSLHGGPVLARGGSGDLLAGMIGAQLAQAPDEPLFAAARGVVWHGAASDALARARGQVAVATTELLDHLGAVLHSLQ